MTGTPFRTALGTLLGLRLTGACLGGFCAAIAQASDGVQDAPASLPTVVVTASTREGPGSTETASQGVLEPADWQARPLLRPAAMLEWIPGLVVTQHSGDGKANQYLLRGMNLDHGTDFATQVNGVPVNLPTHAHGQGYSDLNFLIPELVEQVNYRLGPYLAQDGDFASAGAADFIYRTRLAHPLLNTTLGTLGYARGLVADSRPLAGPDTHMLLAYERQHHDGPWRVPMNLRKDNAVVTLSTGSAAAGGSLSLMSYRARWQATDQIAQRLLDTGTYQGAPFGRYDSLDTSDGGHSERHSLSTQWHRQKGAHTDRLSAYWLQSSLDLYSNFSYALNRPSQGDQFLQTDQRQVAGLALSRQTQSPLAGTLGMRTSLGLQLRMDQIRVGLYDTQRREIQAVVRDDTVRQMQLGLYAQWQVFWRSWLRSTLGLRWDQWLAHVDSHVTPDNSGAGRDTLYSPKFGLVLGPWSGVELFLNAGQGFRSEDARGTTIRVDPRDGTTPVAQTRGLTRTQGQELGVRSDLGEHWRSSLAWWALRTDAELLFLGDSGTTEAGRPSLRRGITWNARWGPRDWLALDFDLTWSQARYSDTQPEGDAIPNAVERVGRLYIQVQTRGPWSGSLEWRHVGAAPLNRDASVQSEPTSLWHLAVGYRLHPRCQLSLAVFNLLDAPVSDIQYWYRSRLPGEATAVNDVHRHPAEPRSVRLSLQLLF